MNNRDVALVAALLATSSELALPASAQTSPPQAQPSPSQAQPLGVDSTIGALLEDPRTRAVVDRHLPNLAANPQIDVIRAWSLRQLATNPHVRGMSPELLTQIQAELAAAQSSDRPPG